MTGVQSAQILGPHSVSGILESKTKDNPIQEIRLGKIVSGDRKGNTSEFLKENNDKSLIDFIN
jgi:hypothetical protein